MSRNPELTAALTQLGFTHTPSNRINKFNANYKGFPIEITFHPLGMSGGDHIVGSPQTYAGSQIKIAATSPHFKTRLFLTFRTGVEGLTRLYRKTLTIRDPAFENFVAYTKETDWANQLITGPTRSAVLALIANPTDPVPLTLTISPNEAYITTEKIHENALTPQQLTSWLNRFLALVTESQKLAETSTPVSQNAYEKARTTNNRPVLIAIFLAIGLGILTLLACPIVAFFLFFINT